MQHNAKAMHDLSTELARMREQLAIAHSTRPHPVNTPPPNQPGGPKTTPTSPPSSSSSSSQSTSYQSDQSRLSLAMELKQTQQELSKAHQEVNKYQQLARVNSTLCAQKEAEIEHLKGA